MTISSNPVFNPTSPIGLKLGQIAQDGKLDTQEFGELKNLVLASSAPESEKKAFLKLAEKVQSLTRPGSDGTIDPQEMQQLQGQATELKDSKLVGQFFQAFAGQTASEVKPSPFIDFLKNLFSAFKPSESPD